MENPDINERYTEINDPLLPISLTIPTSPLKSLQEKNNVAAQVVAQTVAEHYKKSQQQFKDTQYCFEYRYTCKKFKPAN